MIRTVLAMSLVAVGVTAVMAQSDPISQRKALMKSNGQQTAPLNRMQRGEDPFDAAKANTAFSTLVANGEKSLPLFATPPAAGADTRALPKVWETKADFDAKMQAFTKAAADHADKIKSIDDLKVAFAAVNKACNDCHEPYRRPSSGAGGQKK
jgi:cytochrome c556